MAAELHSLGDDKVYQPLCSRFRKEFSFCEKNPNKKVYYLAFKKDTLIGFAGARYYNNKIDESLYSTKEMLPSGWYLKGIRVGDDWQRKGIARKLTQLRLDWFKEKTNRVYVFMTDSKKVAIPMYKKFGFKTISNEWKYEDSSILEKGTLLKKELFKVDLSSSLHKENQGTLVYLLHRSTHQHLFLSE